MMELSPSGKLTLSPSSDGSQRYQIKRPEMQLQYLNPDLLLCLSCGVAVPNIQSAATTHSLFHGFDEGRHAITKTEPVHDDGKGEKS